MCSSKITKENILQTITACGECDLLIKNNELPHGKKMVCPRCDHVIYKSKKNSVDRSLALALAGLILIVPAYVLPIFRLEVLGIQHSANMFTGVMALFKNDMWVLSIVVLLASMLVPLIKLLLIAYITIGIKLNCRFRNLAKSLRWFQHLDEWGMLEVYTLGIIVAYTKLISLADVIPQSGLYCFVAVLLIVASISTVMDKNYFWKVIEEQKNDI